MRIGPKTSIVQLAQSDLLDQLNGNGIVVYLRLVAASAKHGRKFSIGNEELLPHRKTGNVSVRRSLDELEKAKLVKVHYELGDHGGVASRTIELLA